MFVGVHLLLLKPPHYTSVTVKSTFYYRIKFTTPYHVRNIRLGLCAWESLQTAEGAAMFTTLVSCKLLVRLDRFGTFSRDLITKLIGSSKLKFVVQN